MTAIEHFCRRVGGVTPDDIQRWIDSRWLCPDRREGHYVFYEIDEARARLILELRDIMGINEEALPVVLSLLDQLYAARRDMERVRRAITTQEYPEIRELILNCLKG